MAILDPEKLARTRKARVQVGFAFFAFILVGLNDGAVGVLIPSIRQHYGVNNATVATLFLCSAAGYLIAAFNSGPLAAKLKIQHFLLLAVSLVTVSTCILGLAPPFVLLAFLLLVLGFGIGNLDAGLNSLVAYQPRNTVLLNYLHAFYGVGALLGPLVASGILVLGFAWNWVYLCWMGIGIVLFCGVLLLFRGPEVVVRGELHHEVEVKDNLWLSVMRMRVVWFAALFLLFYVGSEVSLGSWSYSILTIDRHMVTLFAGWVVSGYWMGLTLGRLVLGRVAVGIGEARTIAGCVLGAALGVVLVWLIPVAGVAAVGFCFTGFCLGPIFPTTIALISRVVGTRWVGTAIGFLASLGSVGAALFPWIAGNLAQAFGLWSILPFAILLVLMMLLVWLILQSYIRTKQTSRGSIIGSPLAADRSQSET